MSQKTLGLTQITPGETMQTVNGKLVLEEGGELNHLNSKVENVIQRFENLELTVHQETQEYIQQLNLLKASVQNMKQLYNKLLFTTLTTAVVLTILFFWLGSNHQPSTTESEQNTTAFSQIESFL